jgi:RNA polymerase sigma-70 factor (ECF subfamily)
MLGDRFANAADAEDVVQEVLVRVLRGGGGLRDSDRLGAWLATTVRNAVVDQLRSRQRHPLPFAAETDLTSEEGAPPAESETAARQRLVAVLRPFALRLPAIYRDVIIMSELEDVPHAEIARRLSLSVSGVKSRVQRGRERLREMLDACCQISLDARNSVVECLPRSADAAAACCESDASAAPKSSDSSGCTEGPAGR